MTPGRPTTGRPCPNCGTAMPIDSKHQACPKCLLALGDKQAGRRANLTTSPFVAPGASGGDGWSVAELERRFPQLEVLGLIGKGGMGAVYKVRQKTLDRVVALKLLPARASGDAAFEERFVREARTLAKLAHPNIVTVFEFGEQDGLYFFLMEYVDGVNLRSLMGEGKLTGSESLSIVGQICDALQYAHEMAIVHRDIKPENVLIDQRGTVKIADFGLAKILEKPAQDLTLTGAHQVVGTLNYMAPEQRERPGEVDHRADIYSLGVVFYELLTGELPLGRFAPPSRMSGAHAELDEVVMRTLEKNPAERYQHADDLKTDCDRVSSLGAQHRGEPETRHREPERQRGGRLSVPCSLPSQLEGIFDYVGILRFQDGELVLQYRGQEAFLGSSPLGTKEVHLPLNQVDTVEFKRGIAKHSIYITPLDLNLVNNVPGFKNGRVRILVTRADREAAEAIVKACGERGQARCLIPDPPTEHESLQSVRMPAIAMSVTAILSILTWLGVGGAMSVKTVFVKLAPLEIGWLSGGSLVYIGFQLFILWGAREMYHGRSRRLAVAAAIGCLVPISPWSVIGLAIGIWALVVLRREDVIDLFEQGDVDSDRGSENVRPDKPMGDELLRQEAASRLTIPTAGLRLCGCVSILLLAIGAAMMLTDVTVGLWPAALAWRQRVGFVLALAALPGCFLLRANTNSPRRQLIKLSVLGLLPISVIWPISGWFSLWTLVILHDPDVREYQRRASLPYEAAPQALRAIFAAAMVSVVSVVAILWFSRFDDATQVQGRYVAIEEQPELGVRFPAEGPAWETASQVLQARMDDLRIKAKVLLPGSQGERITWSRFMSEDEIKRAIRLCRIQGVIELAILRDQGTGAENTTDDAEASTDLEYAADPSRTIAGLRIAVLSSTRFEVSKSELNDVDASDREPGRVQVVSFELTGQGRRNLLKKWNGAIARADAAQPLRVALIIDGKVCGTGQVSVSDETDLDEPIELSGHYPMQTDAEWMAIVKSGPTPWPLEFSELIQGE